MTQRHWRTPFGRHAAGLQRPVAILALIAAVAVSLQLWADAGLSSFAVFNTFQNTATLGLLALGIGLTVMVGEFDLSSIAVFALGGLLAVWLGETRPLVGVAAAIAAGAGIGLLLGVIMAFTGINSVPLTLAAFIAIIGLNHIVANEGILAYGNFDVVFWLDDPFLAVFSVRSLIVLAVFAALWAALRWTRLGPEIRATGADRRAARASGVPTRLMVAAVFCVSGICYALGGALFAYSTTAAKYDLGLDPFIFAVTAVLIGGVSIQGGRGSVVGILIGVLALSLLDTVFYQIALPTFMVDLCRAALLLFVVVLEVPNAGRAAWWRRRTGRPGLHHRDGP
jgi:ribose/xylose/arabinose/galactoside ABC-type transport system permease subunit